MKKQITRISPIQTSKVVSLMYFAISLPIILMMFITFSFAEGPQQPPMAGMFYAMPFFYLIFSFIFTALAAWVYNIIAKWVGGIEFTTTEIENP